MPPLLLLLLLPKVGIAGAYLLPKLANWKKVDTLATQTPKLLPKQLFSGRLRKEGVMYNLSGKPISHFSSFIDVFWKDNVGHFVQHTDQNAQEWTWKIKGNSLTGKIGGKDPITGTLNGNTLRLNYKVVQKIAGVEISVSVCEWYHLLDSGNVINRVFFTKLGFPLGEISATLRPEIT